MSKILLPTPEEEKKIQLLFRGEFKNEKVPAEMIELFVAKLRKEKAEREKAEREERMAAAQRILFATLAAWQTEPTFRDFGVSVAIAPHDSARRVSIVRRGGTIEKLARGAEEIKE